MSNLAASVSRIIARRGTTYTLRKATYAAGVDNYTQGNPTYAYYPCEAHERGYTPAEIREGILDVDVKVVVDAASLPSGVVPVMGDRIALGVISSGNDATAPWRAVIAVYSPLDGTTYTSHKLQARK